MTVRIGSGTKRYRAPRAQSLQGGKSQRVEVRDATGDGRLTEQDITEAALNWVLARERRAVCSIDRNIVDANGDNCVDVADVQAYAAAVTGASTSRLDATSAAEVDPPFVVNSTGDGADANPGNGICLTSSGTCTLRAAIGEANARTGANTINFSIPGAGVQTIQLASTLPTLSDTTGPTLIDGYSQPGALANTAALADNAQLKIEVRGNGLFSNDGLTITSPGNTIKGIAFYNLHHSIFIFEQNATGNGVYGCFVGTDAAGTFGHTATGGTAGNGVSMFAGAANNQVGGTSLAERNVISGNSRHGVVTYNAGSDNNTVYNNIIGLSPDGARRLPNLKHGIDINADSSFNVVGGTGSGMRNVISGNGGPDFDAGIELSHGTITTGNQVVGNYIGTDLTGTTAPSWTYNDNLGIRIEDGVKNTLVSDNVIVNNRSGGIKVDAVGASGNVITTNRIGITLSGQAAPNNNYGIAVGVGATNNRIGPGNTIANNAGIGVSITDASTSGITVTRNSIYNNNGLGIDLDPQWSVNPNDAGDGDSGPNGLLNYPAIASATTTAVSGSACAGCAVEVFVSDGDFRGAGEGKTHVGSATATGGGAFTAPVSGVSAAQKITATATDAAGNTSEFAINVTAQTSSATAPGAPTLTSATAGNGSVSLQWTPPAADGGATITNYKVYRSTQSGQEVFLTQLGNVTSYTDTGLTNGQIYWYKVSAVNAVGEGALSNERSATPQATVPGAPTLTSANAGNGSVSLQWTPPANGGATITNYNIYRSTQSGQEVFLTQLGNVTSYTDPGLTNGQTYWYKVAAVNSVGVGALSNELSATPQATTVIVSDQFERSVAAGLGTADVGGSWSVSSTQRTKVQGGDAVIYGWSGGSQEAWAWMPTVASDMELLGLVKLNASNPVGANYQLRLMAPRPDGCPQRLLGADHAYDRRRCQLGPVADRQRRRHGLARARHRHPAPLGGGRHAVVDPAARRGHEHQGQVLAKRHRRARRLDCTGHGQLLGERPRLPGRSRQRRHVLALPGDALRQLRGRQPCRGLIAAASTTAAAAAAAASTTAATPNRPRRTHAYQRHRRQRQRQPAMDAGHRRRRHNHELQRLPLDAERPGGLPHPARQRHELHRSRAHERADVLVQGLGRQCRR